MAKSKVQGEGDYEATRRYRKRTEQFLGSHDVDKEARRAAPKSRKDAQTMAAAEAAGKKRAKGEDPALRRRAAPRAKSASRSRARS
jgi:predicted secreted protein